MFIIYVLSVFWAFAVLDGFAALGVAVTLPATFIVAPINKDQVIFDRQISGARFTVEMALLTNEFPSATLFSKSATIPPIPYPNPLVTACEYHADVVVVVIVLEAEAAAAPYR